MSKKVNLWVRPYHIAVMAGLVPAIHVLLWFTRRKTWMPSTRPGMTTERANPEAKIICE